MTRLVRVGAACLVVGGCMGGSRSVHHVTGHATHPTRSEARAQAGTQPQVRRSFREVEAPDSLHATMPGVWYGQTYAATNIIITSFPIHTAKHAYGPIPAGAAAISVFDMPPASKAGCRLHPHAHGLLRLGGYQPNYEAFGAAYRVEFYDHAHNILVFVAFGGWPSPAVHRSAVAVLNSIHTDPRACPISPFRL